MKSGVEKLSDLWINFCDIPDDGLDFDIKEEFSDLGIETDDFDIKEPIHIEGKVTKFGKTLYVKGHLLAKMTMTCSRCIESFSFTLDSEIDATYVPLENESLEEEKELDQSDLDILFYKDDRLDLQEIIRDHIVLSIPLQPLCKPDCLGLCQNCGQDLNVSKCACKTEDIHPKLEILKKLKQN